MTNDNFNNAARAYAEQACYQDENRPIAEAGFRAGWKAARTHLAAQEPTDAEVEAGEESIDCLFGWEHLRRYGGQSEGWMDQLRKSITRNVLSAARAARRDGETR